MQRLVFTLVSISLILMTLVIGKFPGIPIPDIMPSYPKELIINSFVPPALISFLVAIIIDINCKNI